MTTITTRAGKGSPLTNDELDANFANLNDDKIELNDLSVGAEGAASGDGSVAYDNATGVFTYTPPADISGAVTFSAKAGEALTKGDVVYVSGVSGNSPVVSKADADDAAKMPAFGLAENDAALNAEVNVVTFGTLYELDTSSFSAGATVYVSTTAGAITDTAPTGESSLLQNIGKVIRSHASAGSIKVGGAGRTNATPNLNDGNVFIGNSSNQAETRALVAADISDLQEYITGGQTITLTGDASGSGTTSISVTVADDSHNHVIANVDGLQAALDAKLDDSQKGAANGLAELDGSGKVPSSQLPSYVDDVLEYANSGAFPGTGETGKIYIALDTNDVYRWTGSAYVKVSDAVSTADEANTLATARTISLTGDVSGSTSFDGSANVSITATVADDSHNHVISNVDGLQAALDSKQAAATALTTSTTFGGDVSGTYNSIVVADDSHNHSSLDGIPSTSLARSDTSDTISGTYDFHRSDTQDIIKSGNSSASSADQFYLRHNYAGVEMGNLRGSINVTDGAFQVAGSRVFADNYHPNADKWTTARTLILTGDVTGSVSWDGSGNASLTATVADDSHNHVISNVDGLQTALNGKLSTSGKAADSDLLDGLDSGQFLRSDTSDTFTGENLTVNNTLNVRGAIDLADNDILRLGSSDDWECFHDGTHNYMDCNVGDLYIRQGTTNRYLFEVSSGDFHADGNIIAYSTSVSDARLKEDVAVLESPLEIIDQLRGVTFTRIDEQQKSSGVIAQELEKVMPWAIREHKARALKDDDTLYKTVEYDALSALFIESIKELKAEVLELKRQLAEKD